MEFVSFRRDSQSLLTYYDISLSRSQQNLSKIEYLLELKLQLRGNVEIKNTNNNQTIGTCSEIISLNTIVELLFELDDGSNITFFMKLDPHSFNPRLYVGGITTFVTNLSAYDIEKLNEWRRGRRIFLKWQIQGYGTVLVNDINKVVSIKESNFLYGDNLPQLNTNDFDKILNQTNFSKEFLIGFPIGEKIDNQTNVSNELDSFYQDLNICVSNLELAVKEFRNSNSINGYKLTMVNIKSALDSIRKFSDKKQLGKILLIDNGIVGNIDPEGRYIAAEEIMDDLFSIMDKIYQIVSKPGHTQTRKSQQHPKPLKFTVAPDREETLFCLTVSLATLKYLLNRIK